jgi:hypothetical protein
MKILGTTETSYHIEQLIRETRHYLIIVSPYLKINTRLKVELENCFNRCENNIIVYRENQLDPKEYKWLKSQKKLTLISIENLHAKCYLNENSAIISSMNLYEYSQINNHELSVLISGKVVDDEDGEAYLDLFQKINLVVRTKGEAFNLLSLTEKKGTYSMGDLFKKLKEEYIFPRTLDVFDSEYLFICSHARKIAEFSPSEISQDGTRILRNADLGKEKFDFLYHNLIKLGRPKKRN